MVVVHTVVDTEEGMTVDTEEGMAADTEEGMVVDTEEGMAVDTEEGMAADTEEGMAADTEEVFVVGGIEETLVVRPAVEAVVGNREDSSADIALEAANIADRVTAVQVDIQD